MITIQGDAEHRRQTAPLRAGPGASDARTAAEERRHPGASPRLDKSEERPFELRPLVEETLAMMRPAARARGVTLSSTFEPDLPTRFSGDALCLEQLLTHLLSTSLEFTTDGTVTIHVSSRHTVGLYHQLHFAISDTGSAIALKRVEPPVPPFTQARASGIRKNGRAGPGLDVSRKLIAAMGGEIWVQSESGRGSAVHFTVRLGSIGETAAVPPRSTRRPTPAAATSLRILVAEDDDVNRQVLFHMLCRLGHEPRVVSNGLQVLDALRAQGADVVFMDLHMPEMDGLAATQAVHDHFAGKSRPRIIGLTASALAGDRECCLEAGMDDFVTKPVRLRTLAAVLERAAQSRPPGEAGVTSPPPSTGPLPVDPELFAMRIGPGNEALHEEILDLFLAGLPAQLEKLERAIARNNGAAVYAVAHRLKGESASIAAPVFADLASRLAESVREGACPLEQLRALADDLRGERTRIVTWLAENRPLATR